MKKLILLLPLFLFLQSCEKDYSYLDLKNQEYTIFLNLEGLEGLDNYYSSEIFIEEYNDINDIVDIKEWEIPNFSYGEKTFTAHKRTSKIVIRAQFKTKETWYSSSTTKTYYHAIVVHLEGKHTQVNIEGESFVTGEHPLYH